MTFEPVAVGYCDTYDPDAVKAALHKLLRETDGLSFLKPGMRVGLKANMVGAGKPETAITTHPVVLAALTRILLESGAASVTVGDSGGGPWTAGHMNHIYTASGMHVVEEAGCTLNRDFSEKEAVFPEAKQAKSFRYTGWIDSCDALINVCKLKSHGMMGQSNAIKNLFGTVPGIVKPEYHYRYPNPNDFADMIVDIHDYVRPVLHVCDAIEAMEGNGPTQGTPYPLHALLVSKSAPLLDWAAAKMIGMDVDDTPILQAARRRGYLPDTFDKVPIIGDFNVLCVSDFRTIENHNSHLFSNNATLYGRLRGMVMSLALSSKPRVVKRKCVGCKKCFAICPAKAITMKNRLPVIDRKACIKCFCCQEFCPKGAMVVHRAAIARLINR